MVSSISNDISVRLQGVFVVTVFTPALALKKLSDEILPH